MPNWIKLRDDLDTDPRVFTMADFLRETAQVYVLSTRDKDLLGDVTHTVTRNVMRDVTVSGLSRVWFAANRHTTDGVFKNATLDYLDTLAQVPGFGRAMALVGYAVFDPETRTVTLPRFSEYNAPDKNGQRSKTANALRQQRHREKLKTEAEKTSQEAASAQHDVTLRVTPAERDSHAQNNVTPSSSISSSISESESGKVERSADTPVRSGPGTPNPDPDPLGTLKRRINRLRAPWSKAPHWSAEEEHALFEARHNLTALEEQDWLLLEWFFKWANSAANTGQKEPVRVSTRRSHLCAELAAILDRATSAWKQNGAPRLGGQPSAAAVSKSPPPPRPEDAPAPPTDAFRALVRDLKIPASPVSPATDATKPAAA